jgi:hypothetical protein
MPKTPDGLERACILGARAEDIKQFPVGEFSGCHFLQISVEMSLD